jgi:hypothetical protein
MELVAILELERDPELIELIVRVEPVNVVKCPVIVDKVGTWMDERTVSEEVTCVL